MLPPKRKLACAPAHQRGVVVVVSLVLLAVMLILGVATMRLVNSEERMAAQSRDRALALQAVEAALREAEATLEANKPIPTDPSNCTDVGTTATKLPVCVPPAANSKPLWDQDATLNAWKNASKVTIGNIVLQPEFFAEHLGSTFPCGPASSDPISCKRYRVTARVAGDTGRANVMAQTIYATD